MKVSSRGLSCRELVDLVTSYFEDALPAAERNRFEEHVGMCAGCHAHIEQMRVTIATVGSLDPETLDPAVRDAMLAAFRDWKAGRTE